MPFNFFIVHVHILSIYRLLLYIVLRKDDPTEDKRKVCLEIFQARFRLGTQVEFQLTSLVIESTWKYYVLLVEFLVNVAD